MRKRRDFHHWMEMRWGRWAQICNGVGVHTVGNYGFLVFSGFFASWMEDSCLIKDGVSLLHDTQVVLHSWKPFVNLLTVKSSCLLEQLLAIRSHSQAAEGDHPGAWRKTFCSIPYLKTEKSNSSQTQASSRCLYRRQMWIVFMWSKLVVSWSKC